MISLRLRGEPTPGNPSSSDGESLLSTESGAATSPTANADVAQRLQQQLAPKFEVTGTVAVGGMGTVLELRHRQHGGRLAAKVLHPHLRSRPDCAQSFRNEATHLARLGEHPNLLPLLDCELEGDLLYLIFPFIEGEDLDRILLRGPMAMGEVLHMAAQVSSVLTHMESHGIVHGDISPGNLRLDTFGRYRLFDFGLSRRWDAPPQGMARGATPLYQSPEQIQGASSSARSDLYALGLVLAEALTGIPVMQAETLEAVKQKHLDAGRIFPEAIQADAPMAKLLGYLTMRNPQQRPPSAFELSGMLAAMGYERPELEPLRRRKRRRLLETPPEGMQAG